MRNVDNDANVHAMPADGNMESQGVDWLLSAGCMEGMIAIWLGLEGRNSHQ